MHCRFGSLGFCTYVEKVCIYPFILSKSDPPVVMHWYWLCVIFLTSPGIGQSGCPQTVVEVRWENLLRAWYEERARETGQKQEKRTERKRVNGRMKTTVFSCKLISNINFFTFGVLMRWSCCTGVALQRKDANNTVTVKQAWKANTHTHRNQLHYFQ